MTPTGNSIAVAVGSSGRIMATDACGATWANDNISMSGWTRITYCGNSKAITAGSSGRIVEIDARLPLYYALESIIFVDLPFDFLAKKYVSTHIKHHIATAINGISIGLIKK